MVSMADADAQLFHSGLDTTFDGDFNFMGFFETQIKTITEAKQLDESGTSMLKAR